MVIAESRTGATGTDRVNHHLIAAKRAGRHEIATIYLDAMAVCRSAPANHFGHGLLLRANDCDDAEGCRPACE
jgi:hypothetical protein